MRSPISTLYQGKKVRSVGSRLYFCPPNQTFHEFCIQMFQSVFTNEWYQKERLKDEAERHIAAKWYISYCDFINNNYLQLEKIGEAEKTLVKSCMPTGNAWSLITLGYDLYSLYHNTKAPEELINRLKSYDSFQGARYELAIAAIFARLDYEVIYIEDKSEKHWEFNAKHKKMDEIIAVEVKSRHRPGTLHQKGQFPSIEEIKVGIARMLNQAIEQKPSTLPFIIFIDLNIPLNTNVPHPERKWWEDLRRAVEIQGTPTADSPDDFNMLCVTNFSYHYSKTETINTGLYADDLCVIIPLYAKVPFKNKETIKLIHQGVLSYGNVPHMW